MVSHSGLITVMSAPRARRRRGCGATSARSSSSRSAARGPADFVSMADKRAEQTLVEELRHARPDWGLLLEEGGAIEGDPTKPRWIVDPVDGTSNFLHGIPHFAISIAVAGAEARRPGLGRDHARASSTSR